MEISAARYENDDLNLQATELRLGLPGIDDQQCEKQTSNSSGVKSKSKKRTLSDREVDDDCGSKNNSVISDARVCDREIAPAAKQQVVGWPPVRSYRKNSFKKNETEMTGMYVKVSMDGAPYLRKIDLNIYKGYKELIMGLENMFKFTLGHYFERERYNGSEYEPTYEDKDGDWMLVGDVPWDMFISSCKRLRIMRASEPRA